jgi:hypothetical protein
MTSHRLTKSAFKVARSCPTKLYYYRAKYPSLLNENSYLEFLADGGHIVGKLAQLLYPKGILIDGNGDLDAAAAQTDEYLKQHEVILFEAAIRHNNKLVLVDVLHKVGNTVKLIEVKSKCYDSEEETKHRSKGKRTTFVLGKGEIDSKWLSYLEDICYQQYVATLAYPDFEFIPYLFLPDKAKTTNVDCLASMFSIEEIGTAGAGKKAFKVEFSGDVKKVTENSFMTLVNVEEEVALLWDEVKAAAEVFDRSLYPTLTKIETPPSRECSDCEYRTKDGAPSGFRECWGVCADTEPHIFELYYGTAIEQGELFDSLIRARKTSLWDVPTDGLSGTRANRQLVQIRHTKAGAEWFSDALSSVMGAVTYPLHFIDFETSRVAVPYHAGMRPYEQVAFQWSCHTVAAPGATPEPSAWINTKDLFPNFEFARELREKIGERGTVLTWAHHENSVLRDIIDQAENYGIKDSSLVEWLQGITAKDGGRIVDLNRLTLEHYFHPAMKGKTSLKAVLPAIWNNNPELHEISWLTKYVSFGEDGKSVLDPYKTLAEIEIAGQAECVREGTGAMRAYQDMMYGKGRNMSPESRERWRELLLQYCELDTIAMVVVWTYWERRLGLR